MATAGVVLVTATLTAAGTFAAVPASQDFSSSFEAGDPQPTWTDTVDDGKASGVTGPAATGIPGNVTHKVVEVTANGEFADAGEVKENLTDGDLFSKWLVFESTGWVQYRLSEPVKVVLYALGSANDAPERDPQDWTLRASDDGQTWTTLDTHEEPWLYEADGSQRDGAVFDGSARFADGNAHFTYRFDVPAEVTGGTLTLDIGNQFLVQVSPDNQSWHTVLEESMTGDTGLRNRGERNLDPNELRGGSRTLYVRIADAYPPDGWGGWLARLRLEMVR